MLHHIATVLFVMNNVSMWWTINMVGRHVRGHCRNRQSSTVLSEHGIPTVPGLADLQHSNLRNYTMTKPVVPNLPACEVYRNRDWSPRKRVHTSLLGNARPLEVGRCVRRRGPEVLTKRWNNSNYKAYHAPLRMLNNAIVHSSCHTTALSCTRGTRALFIQGHTKAQPGKTH